MSFLDNIIQSAVNKTTSTAQPQQPQTIDLIELANNPGEPAQPNTTPFDGIVDSMKNAANQMRESTKPMVDNAVSSVRDKAGIAFENTKPTVDKVLENAKPRAESAINSFRQKTEGIFNKTLYENASQNNVESVDPFAAALGLDDNQQSND